MNFSSILDNLEDEINVKYEHRYAPRNHEEQELKEKCGELVTAFCNEFGIQLDGVKLIRKTESYGHCMADYYHFYRNRKTGRFTLQLQQVNSCHELVSLLGKIFTKPLTWSIDRKKITPFPIVNPVSDEEKLIAELAGKSAIDLWAAHWLQGK